MQAKTIDQVIEQLEDILYQAQESQSPLGYFPALYKKVTRMIKEKIQQDFFEDNARMERLDVVFANRYLTAYRQFQNQKPCTQCWHLAFEATRKRRLIVLQHLFLGMSAHINMDLGIAAAEVCPGEKIFTLEGDFKKINEVLASLVNEVQKELARIWPMFRWIDWAGGRLDEALADFSMEIARDNAWEVACALAKIPTEEEKQKYIQSLDKRVQRFGRKIERPGIILGSLSRIIRWTEKGTVAEKINYLNK